MCLLSRYNLDTQAVIVQDVASIAIPDSDGNRHRVFSSLIYGRARSELVLADLYSIAHVLFLVLYRCFMALHTEQSALLYFYRQLLVKKKKERYKQRTYIPLTASMRTLASSPDIVAF